MTDQTIRINEKVIRLYRCMECGNLSNQTQEVEVIHFETMLDGKPREFGTRKVICNRCLGRDYGEPV